MRLIINRDEVATFRKLVGDELRSGSTMIYLRLSMSKEDAESMLAKSSDNGPPIECVWASAITAYGE